MRCLWQNFGCARSLTWHCSINCFYYLVVYHLTQQLNKKVRGKELLLQGRAKEDPCLPLTVHSCCSVSQNTEDKKTGWGEGVLRVAYSCSCRERRKAKRLSNRIQIQWLRKHRRSLCALRFWF